LNWNSGQVLAMSNSNGRHDLEVLEDAETADQAGKRQLWERQAGESSKSFVAFQKYLNLSTGRTLAKVAEMSGCSAQNIERWSRRWFWVARVQAYDVIEEERFREQCSRDRLAMRRRQIALGAACQSVAAFGVRELQSKIAAGTPLALAPEQIAALLKVGVDIEGRGMGTEKGLAVHENCRRHGPHAISARAVWLSLRCVCELPRRSGRRREQCIQYPVTRRRRTPAA
jgi:hypothetical protein